MYVVNNILITPENAITDLPVLAIALLNMLMTAKTANSDLPPIGFCIVFLLGGKYVL